MQHSNCAPDAATGAVATSLPVAPNEDLARRLKFILAADALKNVERRTFIGDGSRHENSAEHSWHLAVAVLLFEPLARERNLNLQRALELALLHDLPEIGAGDTYVYDNAHRESQTAREQIAADEIFGLLPDESNSEFRARWEEFENLSSPEAQFVRALDRLLPILLNFTTSGKAWLQHGISAQQVREVNLPILDAAPALRDYCETLIQDAARLGFLRVEASATDAE